MPASLDLPRLLPEVPDRLHRQQYYYFPAVHASVDPDSFSHKTLLQKVIEPVIETLLGDAILAAIQLDPPEFLFLQKVINSRSADS